MDRSESRAYIAISCLATLMTLLSFTASAASGPDVDLSDLVLERSGFKTMLIKKKDENTEWSKARHVTCVDCDKSIREITHLPAYQSIVLSKRASVLLNDAVKSKYNIPLKWHTPWLTWWHGEDHTRPISQYRRLMSDCTHPDLYRSWLPPMHYKRRDKDPVAGGNSRCKVHRRLQATMAPHQVQPVSDPTG